jgi:O-antigen ligase
MKDLNTNSFFKKELSLERLLILFQFFTIALSPLYIIRYKFDLGRLVLPSTFLEILILITLFIFLILIVKEKISLKSLRTKLDPFILIFLVIAAFETFKNPSFIGGLGILKAYFIEPILFYYSIVYTSRKTGLNFLINGIFTAGIWLSLLGILQKLTGSFTLAPHEMALGRVSGVYNSANALALFLGPLVILVIAYLFYQDSKKKIFCIFVFLLFFVNIILTKSRGGMIAEVFSFFTFIYFVLVLKYQLLKKYWLVIPATFTIISVIFLYQFYSTQNFIPLFTGRPYTEGDTLQIRYFIWVGTINMIKDHPVFGAGLNGFKGLYTNQYRLPHYQEEFQYPHNIVLTLWTELGLFGLMAFILLITAALSLVLRNISKSKYPLFGAALFCGIVYWLLHGMVDVPYFKNDLSLEFWIIVCLIVVWSENHKKII